MRSKLTCFGGRYARGNFVSKRGVARVINGCNSAKKPKRNYMSLKIKIAARLKAKAAGVNLSQKRIDAIVAKAEKGLTDESDDTAIDANLDAINDLTPFTEIASFDDHQRAKATKDAAEKEAARLKAIEEGKTIEPELPADTPEWMKVFMKQQADTNKALQDQIAKFGQKEVATTRREQFIKSMEGTSKEYQARELKKFDRISFKDDADFTSFIDDTKDDHATAIQEEANSGLGGDKPAGGAGGNATKQKVASKEELDAIMNSI